MADVASSFELDKHVEPSDGRELPLQAVLDLWLSFSPRTRRLVLRELWNAQERFERMAETHERPGTRVFAAKMIAPTKAGRWVLRAISKAMDPSYDLRADGTPNAEMYRVPHASQDATGRP